MSAAARTCAGCSPTWRQPGYRRGEQLKSRPRGFDLDHPRIDLLRYKSLYAWRNWPPDDALHTPTVRDRVRKVWQQLGPLTVWLDAHVGPGGHGADRTSPRTS